MTTMTLDERRQVAPEAARKKPTRKGLVIRLTIMALILALLGAGIWGFNEFRRQAIAGFFAGNVPPPTPVSAEAAVAGPMPQYLDGIGSLTAQQQVDVAPELAGRVTAILFEAGSEVREGDPLVQLNEAENRAELATYEAQAKLAEANLGRSQRLANRDFAAQSTVDQNAAALDEAQAGIARSQAIIDQKLVKAPFAGVLGIRRVQLGQYVAPGAPLVTLTDLDPLYVDFTLPEQSLAQITMGRPVEVRVDAYPGRVFSGELQTIEPQIDPQTRTIKLRATLANADRLLLPGMFASTRIVLPEIPDVVTVPETAVTQTLYGDSVFIVHDETAADGQKVQKADQTFVTTGPIEKGRIAILNGVTAGDVVVNSGQMKLQSGAAVTIKTENALAMPAVPPIQ